MFNIILKKILEYLSFPSNLRYETMSKRQINIQNKLAEEKIFNKDINSLKTHKVFSNNIFYLLKEKSLKNFLRKDFIQKMFFIHNRFFLIFHLLEILFCKFKILKKILIEDRIGNPVPFFLYKKTSGNRIRCVYHLKKLLDFCERNKFKSNFDIIVEVGGGYGCFARIYKRMYPMTKFIIFDTPEVSRLQYYYLSSLKYSVKINKYSNDISIYDNLPKFQNLVKKFKKKKILFISTWAISEMPISLRDEILKCTNSFSAFVIAYQGYFEKINNNLFFFKFGKKLNKNFIQSVESITAMNFFKIKNRHYYLLSLKKNVKNYK